MGLQNKMNAYQEQKLKEEGLQTFLKKMCDKEQVGEGEPQSNLWKAYEAYCVVFNLVAYDRNTFLVRLRACGFVRNITAAGTYRKGIYLKNNWENLLPVKHKPKLMLTSGVGEVEEEKPKSVKSGSLAKPSKGWENRKPSPELLAFVKECCSPSDFLCTESNTLYLCYERWAKGKGLKVHQNTWLSNNLKVAGYVEVFKFEGRSYRVGIVPKEVYLGDLNATVVFRRDGSIEYAVRAGEVFKAGKPYFGALSSSCNDKKTVPASVIESGKGLTEVNQAGVVQSGDVSDRLSKVELRLDELEGVTQKLVDDWNEFVKQLRSFRFIDK